MSPMAGAFVIKPPIVAYVTFHTVGGRHACLTAYPRGLLHHVFMSQAKRLRGNRIVVRPAPPPESLAWEHIGAPQHLSALLQVVFGWLVGILIVVPFALVYAGRKSSFSGYTFNQDESLVDGRQVKPCSVNPIPSLPFLRQLNDSSILPSTQCVCSWMPPPQSTTGQCTGWHMSVTVQALGPLAVRAHLFPPFPRPTACCFAQVVIVNLAMGWLLRYLSKFEGHYSRTRLDWVPGELLTSVTRLCLRRRR